MKHIFGFLKNKTDAYEYEEDWDELEDMEYSDEDSSYNGEEPYYTETYTDEGYEANETYEDSEGYEANEAYEDSEVYETDGEYEDGEYYAEEYEGGEYYAEEYEDGEYYAEEYEGGEYYGEEYEDGEYYADEYEDEEAYEESYEDEDWQEPMPVNFFEKIRYAFVNMDMTDRIITCAGVAVLILALVTGSVFASTRITNKQVNSFASVGTQLDGIAVIGGDGLMAVADAKLARQEAANVIEEEGEEPQGYEEAEYSKEVTVSLNMTSIKKDLKIKFVNKKTGKLIPNVPFEVTVTDPKGKTMTWKDEDKDGIIYKTEITSGKYSVALNTLTGYDDYKVSTTAQSVKVKENLDYEKVDVSDEIKKESEIDASKEDTAKNDVVEESRLQDTVAWVESNRIPINETYTEVSKSTIDEPKVARFDNFVRMAGSNGETVSIAGGGGSVNADASVSLSAGTSGFGGTVSYQWSVTPEEGVTATLSSTTDASVTLTVKNTTSSEKTVKVSVKATSSEETTVSDNTVTKTYSDTAETTIKVAAAQSATATISKSTLALNVGGTATLTAKVGEDATGFTWTSSDPTVAEVTNAGVVTAKKAGTATITATHTGGASATCTVTVTAAAMTIKLDKTTGTVQVAKTLELVPTLTGNTVTTNKITWSSSDAAIATVTGDNTKAVVTGVKAGDVTITASYAEGGQTITATCAVKVQNNPALDTTTALKDKSGNQIYVMNAQGQYAAATYADYFKENQKFYIRQQGYKYTGWQTLDGKVYYFDANGNKVTGAQVIQGAQYSFDSNGVMVSSNGILGIDVSKWNGSIDWNAVKNSGVSYVIIRCGYRGSSQGSLIEDPKYRTNIQGATAAGLKVGVYFFTQAINEIEAVEEASMVLSLVKGYKLSYPIFLDVESSGGRADGISKETRTAVCKAFCQTIKNSGYTAGVYANKTWFTSYIDASQLSAYRIWLAQYASQPTYTGRYDIWQYSSKGKVSGISGNVDMNLSYMGY